MTNRKESKSKTPEALADRVYRRSRSEGSVRTYTWGVKGFWGFVGKDPDTLIRALARGELALERSLNG